MDTTFDVPSGSVDDRLALAEQDISDRVKQGAVALVNDANYALQNIAKDQYFLRNGEMYRALEPIAQYELFISSNTEKCTNGLSGSVSKFRDTISMTGFTLDDTNNWGIAWGSFTALPVSDWYRIFCYGNVQFAVELRSEHVFSRLYANGSWGAWKQLYPAVDGIAAQEAGGTAITTALSKCTGTMADKPCYHYNTAEPNIMMIDGRLTVTSYVRTGANPGFIITLPNNKKLKKGVSIKNIGYTADDSNKMRHGEMLYCSGTAGGTTITFQTTETYTNMGSSTASRGFFVITPFFIEVY